MWPFDEDEENTPQPPVAPDASPPMAATPEAMNPQVKDYLTQKYGLDQYSPEKRQAIEAQNAEEAKGPNWLAGLAAFGAGIQGRDASAAGANILNMQKGERQARLDSFDKNRALAMQQIGEKDMLAKREREKDPNSMESKLAQQLAGDMGIDPKLIAGMSAEQLQSFSPVIQKRYDIEQRKLDRQEQRDERRFLAGERSLERKEAREQRLADKGEKEAYQRAEKEQALQTPYGLANSVDDAKQLKEAHESKKNFDSKIDELINLRKTYGGEVANREAVARAKQLSKDLLLEYKNMAKLGVLSQSDENIINAIIPSDPLEFTPSSLVGQDPILSNLTKFRKDSDKDFATKVSTRTREGLAKAQAGGEGGGMQMAGGTETKVVGGKTYKKVPGGWVPLDGQTAGR